MRRRESDSRLPTRRRRNPGPRAARFHTSGMTRAVARLLRLACDVRSSRPRGLPSRMAFRLRAVANHLDLRQRAALDAADTAELLPGRDPVLSGTGGEPGRQRLDDRSVRSGAIRGYPRGQLAQTTKARLVRAPAPHSTLAPFVDKSWRSKRDRSRQAEPIIEVPTNRRGNGHP
jgi:hypothetical protein